MWESESEPEEEVDLAFIGAEALAEKRRIANEKKVGAVPRLRVQNRIETDKSSDVLPEKMPPLPPRKSVASRSSMLEYDEEPAWYRIKSPREEHGAVGPSTVQELAFMYKSGEIHDDTLLWREGSGTWEPLCELHQIKGKVQGMPNVPSKLGLEEREKGRILSDLPRSEVENNAVKLSIYRTELWCGLCKGNLATYNMPGYGEQTPDLSLLRKAAGSTESVREVMDGFLFVGNKDVAKLSTIVPMGMTLVIGTADKFKNPAARPPHFRCQMVKLKDRAKFKSMPPGWMNSIQFLENGGKQDPAKILAMMAEDERLEKEGEQKGEGELEGEGEAEGEGEGEGKEEAKGEGEREGDGGDEESEGVDVPEPMESLDIEAETTADTVTTTADGRLLPAYDPDLKKMLKFLERCADWIEVERVNPLLGEKGDPVPEKYRGPVDRYGRPKRDDENGVKTKTASQRQREGLEKRNPSRVLLWSKRGDNRCCLVAAAYLIKRFGMTVAGALKVVGKNIPEMKVTAGHMWALEQFSLRHTLGLLLCDDCVVNAMDEIHEQKIQAARSQLAEHHHHLLPQSSADETKHEAKVGEGDTAGLDSSELEATEKRVVRTGTTGLPYVESRLERQIQVEHTRQMAKEKQALWAQELDAKATESSNASRRFRRRRRRSRYPNEKYDDLEARAASSLSLVSLCSEGIFEILPLCSVPQFVCTHETYSMLCDLELSGRGLNDESLGRILDELVNLDVANKLRLVNVSNNHIGDAGVRALCAAVWADYEEVSHGPNHKENHLSYAAYPDTDLTLLYLQNNRIGAHGAVHLANLLRYTASIMTLDVSNNNLTDDGCHHLLHVMVKPGQEFEGDSDDESDGIDRAPSAEPATSTSTDPASALPTKTVTDDGAHIATEYRPYNRSVFDLRITDIGMKSGAADTLANMLSRTETLFSLCLDANMELGARGLKNVIRSIKTSNKTLHELYLNDIKMLPSHFELVLGVLEEGYCQLRKLSIARCGLTKLHMSKMDGALGAAKYLSDLDLSGNNFGDKGAKFLAEELFASTGHSHGHHEHGHGLVHHHAAGAEVTAHYGDEAAEEEEEEEMRHKRARWPLAKLELCSCGISMEGVVPLLAALKWKKNLTALDLSENNFQDKEASVAVAQGVRRLTLRDLRLNRCKLGTMGTRKILRAYTPGAPVRVDVKGREAHSAVDGPPLSPTSGDSGGDTRVGAKAVDKPGVGFLGLSDPFGTLNNYEGLQAEGSVESSGLAGGVSLTLDTEPSLDTTADEEASRAMESIRVLALSGNGVHNPVGKDLFWLLERNVNLSLLDLGFNNITDAIKKHVLGSLTVVSSSSDDKKLRDLHINMVGNPCDQSLFETPSLTRSKVTFEYAMSGGNHSHVPKQDVDAFKKRLEYSLMAHRDNPTPRPNFIL